MPSTPSTSSLSPKRWLAAAGLVTLLAFAFQGSRGLYHSTEARYALVALEMLESGNWLEPTLEGNPHWTKPPLTYWTIAGGMALLGPNAWGARLGHAVCFILSAAAAAWMGRRLWDKRTGFAAGLVYATSPFVIAGMAGLSTDMILATWETLAVAAYVGAWTCGEDRARRWWVRAMWLGFGLAFLTKGPPGLLPLIGLIAWRFRTAKRIRLLDPLGLLAFVVTGMGWYLVMCWRYEGLLSYFLGSEVVNRVATREFERNSGWGAPFFIYLPALTVGAAPWLFMVLNRLGRLGLHRPGVWWRRLRQGTGPGSFLVWWFFPPLVIFVLAQSRLAFYVLPLMTPVSLALGRAFLLPGKPGGQTNRGRMRLLGRTASITAVVLIVFRGAIPWWPDENDMTRLTRFVQKTAQEDEPILLVMSKTRPGLRFYLRDRLRMFLIESDDTPGLEWPEAAQEVRQIGAEEGPVVVLLETKVDDKFLRYFSETEVQEITHDTEWTAARLAVPNEGEQPSRETP